jgi:hypothetical protein
VSCRYRHSAACMSPAGSSVSARFPHTAARSPPRTLAIAPEAGHRAILLAGTVLARRTRLPVSDVHRAVEALLLHAWMERGGNASSTVVHAWGAIFLPLLAGAWVDRRTATRHRDISWNVGRTLGPRLRVRARTHGAVCRSKRCRGATDVMHLVRQRRGTCHHIRHALGSRGHGNKISRTQPRETVGSRTRADE